MKDWIYKLSLAILIVFGIFLFSKLFIAESFHIPSESMLPTLMPGDRVIVNKTCYGTRLFNVFKNEIKHTDITRLPGFSGINRCDVLVFNSIKQNFYRSELSFDKSHYVIKRCMGLPGDSLQIIDCRYYTNGQRLSGVFDEGQRVLAEIIADSVQCAQSFDNINAFPFNCGWTLNDFGPLYIPKRGDVVEINEHTMSVYGGIIRWETPADIVEKDGQYFVNDTVFRTHKFLNDCYFMAGDFAANSTDSRIWGLVPADFIVGKATRIWFSTAEQSGRIGTKL